MANRRGPTSSGRAHRFGGDWTTTKLDVLGKYLHAYTTALKDQPFVKAYIDAFAGTGYRTMREEEDPTTLSFPDFAQPGSQELLEGSALIALKTQPRFQRYIFIERDAARCRQLESLRSEFASLSDDISVKCGEANEEIQKLCAKTWSKRRAVLFLDPYGMQVEWQTIESIAKTGAIDLWLLFPLGIGVSRLLTKSGRIPAGWRTRLNKLLGTEDWYDEFYRVDTQRGLFGDEELIIKATNATIAQYFKGRLRSVFPAVAEPGVLRNSSNCPLFLLCFAASNESGAPIALRIAENLLKDIR